MQPRLAVRSVLLAALAVAAVAQAQSQAESSAPSQALKPVLPADLHWVSPPQLLGMQSAWVLGTERGSGPYVLRVKLTEGASIPPHTHPDARITTVLEGTVYVGFGNALEPARVVAVPKGGVYVVPANVAHYVLAKDGEALYQENGVGPTSTAMLAPMLTNEPPNRSSVD